LASKYSKQLTPIITPSVEDDKSQVELMSSHINIMETRMYSWKIEMFQEDYVDGLHSMKCVNVSAKLEHCFADHAAT